MKKIHIVVLALACMAAATAQAQDVGGILRSVERNNRQLQALRKNGEARKLDISSQNNLDDPSVEYSPFFAKGVGGVASSEMVVSQGFDFPTLYAARGKAGRLQKEVVDLEYLTARRDILLSAKQLCLDMILLNQQRDLLRQRAKNADGLLALYERRLRDGDATVLEVNKIKMDRMGVRTEMAQNAAAHRTALESLLAVNGNMPLTFDAAEYPQTAFSGNYEEAYDRAVSSELAVRVSAASVRASEQEVSVNRQNWIPKIDVGYRRNTEGDDSSNGFMVGASIPLFSGRGKLRAAKARLAESRLLREEARLQTESAARARINEMRQLREAADAYDVPLMTATLELLRKAVEGGELSVIEYYVEADGIYRNLQARMQIENQYQKLIADVYKNEL